MVDVYCHLAMSDIDNSVRKLNGLPPKETGEKDKSLCPHCGNTLCVGALECRNCGEKFSTKSACELDEHQQNLIKLGKALLMRVEKDPNLKVFLKDHENNTAT